MKVAFIVPSLEDSGLTRIPFLLAQNLLKDCFVKIFYFKDAKSRNFKFNVEVPTKKISLVKFDDELNEFDVIHSHGMKPDCYTWLNMARIRGKKITTVHGFRHEELMYSYGMPLSVIYNALWNFVSSKFDRLVFTVGVQQNYYRKIGLKDGELIYNGVPRISVNSVQTIKSSNMTNISTLSNLGARKGIDQILKVLALNEQYHLTLIGGSNIQYIQNLQSLASKLDVGQRCYFLGFVDNPWEIILESDVFIFPSRSEGFGIALVEAASLGIPIICSDIPTFREMFDDNEVTFFKLDDIDDLNNKILMLDEIKDKVSLAKLKAEKLFSLESMCYNYYQEYKKLIDAN